MIEKGRRDESLLPFDLLREAMQMLRDLAERLIGWRRDLHRYPEAGWCEFRTASLAAVRLEELGYRLRVGKDVVDESAVMGRDAALAASEMERALRQGAPRELVERMDGFPALVGTLETGRPGPVVSLRFDMDAVGVSESGDEDHRPFREGFASVNSGLMHACGHDGHVAMGLGLAEVLAAKRHDLSGVVHLIFQPAEEGVRGAKAMVEKGILDDSDIFLVLHLGMGFPSGTVVGGAGGFLCTTKFDVEYLGCSAHAGAAPQEGRNALLAAACTVLNLHAIAPHAEGPSRINVGFLQAGEGRNVIPGRAFFQAETRGATEAVAAYVLDRAKAIVAAGADMHGVDYRLSLRGESTTARSDEGLVDRIMAVSRSMGCFAEQLPCARAGGSDDAAWMMRRVQDRGGQASYLILGADLAAGHHNGRFDFDESVLVRGVELLERVVSDLLSSV